ncbi:MULTISPECIES: CaiB/BaiF CoA-transferase family protein [Hyphomicrobiales]|jgi:crotonobetainyl-CoA:carnitine CoA-transferase CaiB-like acyl-CoA transferase|uniref:CaiB/BaiF CoA transferase family protein n=1 Tax=Methylobacterium sp. CCH7-A2 TaxID=1768789 RepID=UPI00083606A2|nr:MULTISPECIES: CaiB/BaiF CoA-transferase family protein [Hyphomicrobiales]
MGPLTGTLVISVEQALAVPLCTARLAEAGARVIKIERQEGDFARGYDKAAKGASSYVTWVNQGKESLVLDFRTPEDAELLERLVAKADVFIQNLAPGAMARAGFGSERLRKAYPTLVTLDVTGYGDGAATKALKAYDFLIQAESGLISVSGGENELGRIGVSICDIGAGMTAHAAVLEALLLRDRTGNGAALSVSLFDVAADWMTVPLVHQEYGRAAPKRTGLKHPSMAPYGAFRTSEGALTLISIQNEREWQRFCESVLGWEPGESDSRFASNNDRVAHRDDLEAIIGSVTSQLTQDEFMARLTAANVAFGRVNDVVALGKHPALRRRPVTTEYGDKITIPSCPIRWLERESQSTLSATPTVGQHSQMIREEFSALRNR